MSKLIIVESPSKATTIQKYLKDLGYKVIASKGHIRDLPIKELGIDIKNDFAIHDVTMEGKEKVIKEIKDAVKDAEEIYLASDPDREGEKISQSIFEILSKKDQKKCKRIKFNSVTKESVLKSIQNAGEINEQMCDAQRVRRILDRLVGYKISPILQRKIGPGLSAGRVQSVALRIIVEREELIKNFVAKTWFSIFAQFNKDKVDFKSEYFGKQPKDKEILNEQKDADEILAKILGKDFKVHSTDTKETEQKPTPPFTTSKMQQDAAQKLKFDAKQTMQVAQKLYEQGFITYMRTDSVRVEAPAIDEVRKFIESKFGSQYVPAKPVEHKDKKAGNIQDAHEAIRPTDLNKEPETMKSLSVDEYQLYNLIYQKFVSSQMINAILEKTLVMLECEGYFFKTTGTVIKFDGYKKAFEDVVEEKSKKKGEDEDDDGQLPKLNKDEMLTPVKDPEVKKLVESPPPRFTEATLVKELEHRGIGRPSTYASIISNIISRSYVTKDKTRFHPSEQGTYLCNILVKHFPREMDVKFTANVEDTLDLIEDGTQDWLKFMKEFWAEFEKYLMKAEKDIEQIRKIEPSKFSTGIKCLVCDTGEYIKRKGRNGEFLACSNYPTCTSTQNFKEVKGVITITEKEVKPLTLVDKKCPVCGSSMAVKSGKAGDFYACSAYPKCTCTIPMTTTGVVCPTCKKGEICSKTSQKGTIYWGCSNYKECKQVYWNESDIEKLKNTEKEEK